MPKRVTLIWIGFVCLALACNTLSNLPAQGERNPQLEGEFDVNGTNPDGSQYFGSAEIVYDRGGYIITWEIAGDKVIGRGKWADEEFTVVYDGGRAVYTLNEFGTLTGTWFLEGDTRPGTETLAPMTLRP